MDYGVIDAHALLWNFGVMTKGDLLARLALVPLAQVTLSSSWCISQAHYHSTFEHHGVLILIP